MTFSFVQIYRVQHESMHVHSDQFVHADDFSHVASVHSMFAISGKLCDVYKLSCAFQSNSVLQQKSCSLFSPVRCSK